MHNSFSKKMVAVHFIFIFFIKVVLCEVRENDWKAYISNWTDNQISITIWMSFQAPIEWVGVKVLDRQLLTILELDKKINGGTVSKTTKLLSRRFGEVFNCRKLGFLLTNCPICQMYFLVREKSCVFCVYRTPRLRY